MGTVLDIVKDFGDVGGLYLPFSSSFNLHYEINPIAKTALTTLKLACDVCLVTRVQPSHRDN